jgi:hypothetical protein
MVNGKLKPEVYPPVSSSGGPDDVIPRQWDSIGRIVKNKW